MSAAFRAPRGPGRPDAGGSALLPAPALCPPPAGQGHPSWAPVPRHRRNGRQGPADAAGARARPRAETFAFLGEPEAAAGYLGVPGPVDVTIPIGKLHNGG